MTDFLNLRDHVIVITGAASGMGRAIAQAASREGARLVLSDFDGERLAATAGELKGEVRHLRADVTRLPEIDAVFALAEREFGADRRPGHLRRHHHHLAAARGDLRRSGTGSSRSTPRAPSSRSRPRCGGCSRAARGGS